MRRLALTVMAAAVAATPAAAEVRYFAYEAADPAARHRTGDVTLEVERPMFGAARVRSVFRRRGADLPLGGARPPFAATALAQALGAADAQVRPVADPAAAGFSQGACGAVQPVWLAITPPRRFQPLRLQVLRRDEAGSPVVCETLTYRWRAEWDVPDRRRLPREDPRPSAEPF